jgi:hypothetical protein
MLILQLDHDKGPPNGLGTSKSAKISSRSSAVGLLHEYIELEQLMDCQTMLYLSFPFPSNLVSVVYGHSA